MPPDELDHLRQLAEQAASEAPDWPELLACAITSAVDGGTDPWMIAGVLIAGLAHAIDAIPEERRREAGLAAVRKVIQQLRGVGAV